jgi:hypothetical protein
MHLGMVVQWEDRFYKSATAATPSWATRRTLTKAASRTDRIYPDYVKICEGFGVKCERVMHKKDLRGALSACSREGALRARRDGALHRARAADDSRRRDLQGRHQRALGCRVKTEDEREADEPGGGKVTGAKPEHKIGCCGQLQQL